MELLDPELFTKARWHELYEFFVSGEPPLVTRLMVINTLFLVLFMYRRAKNRSRLNATSSQLIQGLLIVSNCFVMFSKDLQLLKVWTAGQI